MRFKYFDILVGIFVAVLLISNVVAVKIVKVSSFSFAGGTLLFPLAYIFGDIFTEVYGYKRTRRIIWTGFGANILMAIVFIVIGKLPAASGWVNQAAYDAILGWVPRIVLASILAYWVGEFINSFVLAKMKIWTQGKWLWTRTIGSTVFGELLDTIIFVLIAFWGALPSALIFSVVVSNYILKVGVEIIFTPITYWIVRFLKRKEGIDTYDYKTKFTPFSLDHNYENQ
ncbi:MAG TPA: queuosine precursor transporter [Candidatus Paceibacterota bacterium]|nr:queuosine precursor transporter [Candidatus Paceibacterota bacterium]